MKQKTDFITPKSMKFMKNSALSLTLAFLALAFLTTSCANNKRYQNIGCYSYESIQTSNTDDCKITKFTEVQYDANLASKEINTTD